MRTRDFEASFDKDVEGKVFLGMEKNGKFIFIDEATARMLANFIIKELGRKE
jgi:hypothetical protein